jgi:hypothetical protein
VLYKTREIAEKVPDVFAHIKDFDSNGSRSRVYDMFLDFTFNYIVLGLGLLSGLQIAHWAWVCCRRRNKSIEKKIEAKDKGNLKFLKQKSDATKKLK